MKQSPLPREQVLAIDKFFADRLAEGVNFPSQLSDLLCAQGHRRMADRARIQQVECCHCTGSNADTKKGCHYRWYVKEYHLFIDGSDGRVLSTPYA